jgi:hypothetical protein
MLTGHRTTSRNANYLSYSFDHIFKELVSFHQDPLHQFKNQRDVSRTSIIPCTNQQRRSFLPNNRRQCRAPTTTRRWAFQ